VVRNSIAIHQSAFHDIRAYVQTKTMVTKMLKTVRQGYKGRLSGQWIQEQLLEWDKLKRQWSGRPIKSDPVVEKMVSMYACMYLLLIARLNHLTCLCHSSTSKPI
jgi:phosphoribosylaminoimidazole carboxylase (NCAIR synthetase)